MSFRVLAVLVAIGCGGRYGGEPLHAKQKSTKPSMDIEAAALPYQIVDARTGHEVTKDAFWTALRGAHAVCVGEEHPNPHHHWVQLEVVRHLAKEWQQFALGMEMFQRPFQGVLDDFAQGRISDDALRSRTGWEERWGYDYQLYRPIFAAAVAAHASLVALNASKELTKKIAHHGLESLSDAEKREVPELNLDDAAHRAWFDDLMENMGGSEAHSRVNKKGMGPDDEKPGEMPSADRIYTVQVMWDETMADTAVKWLRANPSGRIVILAGTGHCHDSAIVNRIKRRGVTDVVSLKTIVDDGMGGVAEALAKPMNDYLVVLELPEDMKAQIKAEAAKE